MWDIALGILLACALLAVGLFVAALICESVLLPREIARQNELNRRRREERDRRWGLR